ncbi:hypothetical protein J6590_056867 [Homalodisca vitripennis]|nr:hypothetical protein J6590_056867 [Homalodisca vitripennis]
MVKLNTVGGVQRAGVLHSKQPGIKEILPTPAVIPNSRFDLSNYPCPLEFRHLRLVVCHCS